MIDVHTESKLGCANRTTLMSCFIMINNEVTQPVLGNPESTTTAVVSFKDKSL